MYRMIGADQREYGPVSADQLREWIRDNRANGDTKAQQEGESGWRPLNSFPEFASDLAANSAPAASPPSTQTADSAAFSETALEGAVWVDMFECLGRSWQLFKAHAPLVVGANFLVSLILVGSLSVPYVGLMIGLVIVGPLSGGLYLLYLKLIRGESAGIAHVFAGLDQAFVPLMLAQIIVSALTALSGVLFFFAVALGYVLRNSAALPIIYMMGFCGLVPMIYLAVGWIFTIPLVIDKQLGVRQAMDLSRRQVNRCWWPVFGLVFLRVLPSAAEFLVPLGFPSVPREVLFGVGLLTSPFFLGALMYAYEDLFGAPKSPVA
jgi:hypothetical protein